MYSGNEDLKEKVYFNLFDISLELTRVNPDRNIFSINVELKSISFTLHRFGLSPSPNYKSLITVITAGHDHHGLLIRF